MRNGPRLGQPGWAGSSRGVPCRNGVAGGARRMRRAGARNTLAHAGRTPGHIHSFRPASRDANRERMHGGSKEAGHGWRGAAGARRHAGRGRAGRAALASAGAAAAADPGGHPRGRSGDRRGHQVELAELPPPWLVRHDQLPAPGPAAGGVPLRREGAGRQHGARGGGRPARAAGLAFGRPGAGGVRQRGGLRRGRGGLPPDRGAVGAYAG